jgi:hypothetical protein
MAATVRNYTTGTNWSSTTFFDRLEQAFADVGFLGQDDRGLSDWSLAGSPPTVPSASGKLYLATPSECSLDGAISPSWAISRNGAGALLDSGVAAVTTGSNFRGRGYHAGSWSSSGTTVTVTAKAHGLSGTRRIYVDSGPPAIMTGFRDAVVLNENQLAYTITGTTGGTTSGSISFTAFAGTYERLNDIVTVTSPGHDLVNGSFVTATVLSGTLLGGLTLLGPVTIVSPDVFTFPSTGGSTTGVATLRHTIKINGGQLGGTDGADTYISVQRAGGLCGSSTTFSWRGTYNSFPYVMWKMKTDSSKKLGQQYMKITYAQSSYLQPIHYATFNPQNETFGSATSITKGWDDAYYSINSVNDGNVNSVTITTYQSALDPDFVVFVFRQANTFRSAIIFHKFKPIASAPYTLDQLAHGSYTSIPRYQTNLVFQTQTQSSVITAERLYISRQSPSTTNSGLITTYEGGSGNFTDYTYTRAFINQVFPTSEAFGPLVNKLPINVLMVPSFYTMPDEFGIIPVSSYSVIDNDIITVSPSEIYTVIRVGTEIDKVAFVCRTT